MDQERLSDAWDHGACGECQWVDFDDGTGLGGSRKPLMEGATDLWASCFFKAESPR